MRVALFGGTFDPPHRGHLAIATAAADAFQLDRVLFAPAGRQPLKPEAQPAPFADRLAMVALACQADPRFEACTLDAPHPDGSPNYTVDTLTALDCSLDPRLHPDDPQATLFSLIGADSFLDLPRWRQFPRLLELAEWIVISRPGFPLDDGPPPSHLPPSDLSPGLNLLHLTPHQRVRIHLLQTVHEDVASTVLRQRLQVGDSCPDLLLPSVSSYILTHGLYREPSF